MFSLRSSSAALLALAMAMQAPASAQDLVGGAGGLSNFPIYTQPDQISCGPTSCAMVLKYLGRDAGVGPLKTKAGTRWLQAGNVRVGMTLPSGIENALEGYGIAASVRKGSIEDIPSYIKQKRPPILLVRSGRETWHYIVATGYMEDGGYIKIADPSGVEYWIRSDALDGIWQFSHRMGDLQRDPANGKTARMVSHIDDPKCKVCGGDGNLGWTKCAVCSGTGELSAGPLGKTKCTACSGQGKWSTKCTYCGGDGKETDYYRKAVESAGVSGHTLIVPDNANANRINYTIKNASNKTVQIRLPSGKTYSLNPGQRGEYFNHGDPDTMTMLLINNQKQYKLVSGNHRIRWVESQKQFAFDLNFN